MDVHNSQNMKITRIHINKYRINKKIFPPKVIKLLVFFTDIII